MASQHIQVTLSVQNVTASVAFYRDVLGFDFQGYWDPVKNEATPDWAGDEQPPYAEVRWGEARIGFLPSDASPSTEGIQLSLHIDDLEGFRQQLIDRGANPDELIQQDWGPATFDLRDPGGYLWKFLGPA